MEERHMRALAILTLLLLAACEPNVGSQPLKDSPSGEGTATYLGSVDGCRLWSVRGGLFYFANCKSGTTSTGWEQHSGKTSHYYTATVGNDD